jgi:hypothetical protein
MKAYWYDNKPVGSIIRDYGSLSYQAETEITIGRPAGTP